MEVLMPGRLGRIGLWSVAAVALIVMASGAFAADSWVTVNEEGEAVIQSVTSAGVPEVTVIRSDVGGVGARFDTPGFVVSTEETSAGTFSSLRWPDASIVGEIGEPGLPVIRRLLVAPPGAAVKLTIFTGENAVLDLEAAGLPWAVMPVQPPIEKIPGALQAAEFRFDPAAYAGQAQFGTLRASIYEAGIARGQRLLMLEVRPIAYHPEARTLTFWPDLRVQVQFTGGDPLPTDMGTLPGIRSQVLNPELLAPDITDGSGNYLIIVADAYEAAIASFAAAKASQGFTVTTHTVSGASNTDIKAYIQGLWGGASSPDYVLLVGDTDTVPNWIGGGTGTPNTDLPYACMDGGDDWYPDLAIGRFPVRNTDQLAAIVDKTLYYENGVYDDPLYKMRAVFMASTDNYTVSEGTHNWVIDNYMDPNGYTSDKLYTYTYNATTQDVHDSFNDGRFFGVYSGHGGSTSWADGPPFSQTDVNNLMNLNEYPVVFSFACVTGSYHLTECFTETWIRAEDKGAVGIYGSSVNSYWTEDDVLEKRLFDSIFDEDDDVPPRLGPVWNDTLMRYLAQMGSGGTTRRYFEMYNLMGDPALLYFGTEAPPTGLRVSPFGGLVSEGDEGGPFTPDSIVYTLENLDATSLDYSVNNAMSWVSLSDTGGTLAGGATTDVTVSINADANTLPVGTYSDSVNFINETNHDGDTSRSVDLTVGVPSLQYSWTLDFDPAWTTEGQWAWGQPTGGGGSSGDPDPTSGYTGTYVYGYNLDGDYPAGMSETHLTTAAIDCAGLSQVSVKFQRWLGVESASYDHAYFRVSNDGVNWTQVWANGSSMSDGAWVGQEFDISSVADNQPTVYLRWTMGSSDGSVEYCGWNIDDIEIWGLGTVGPQCYENADCDDGHWCNGAELCVDDYCQAGTPVDCDDGVGCTDDSCNEILDECDSVPNDAYCIDTLFCNGVEYCDAVSDCQLGPDPCGGLPCDEVHDLCMGCNFDGTCGPGEDCDYCPSDCVSGTFGGCGNGVCELALFEDCLSCPEDCRGRQTGKLSARYCCGDGDGQGSTDCRDPRCTENEWDCSSSDPGQYCCGDGACEPGEDACSCSIDCGSPPPSETICDDGIDNDCDGLVDGDDSADCVTCRERRAFCNYDFQCCSNDCHNNRCK
jgi:hypothetical protein